MTNQLSCPFFQSHLKQNHGGEYVHECGLCSRRYKTEKTLKEHFEKSHNMSAERVVVEQGVF